MKLGLLGQITAQPFAPHRLRRKGRGQDPTLGRREKTLARQRPPKDAGRGYPRNPWRRPPESGAGTAPRAWPGLVPQAHGLGAVGHHPGPAASPTAPAGGASRSATATVPLGLRGRARRYSVRLILTRGRGRAARQDERGPVGVGGGEPAREPACFPAPRRQSKLVLPSPGCCRTRPRTPPGCASRYFPRRPTIHRHQAAHLGQERSSRAWLSARTTVPARVGTEAAKAWKSRPSARSRSSQSAARGRRQTEGRAFLAEAVQHPGDAIDPLAPGLETLSPAPAASAPAPTAKVSVRSASRFPVKV